MAVSFIPRAKAESLARTHFPSSAIPVTLSSPDASFILVVRDTSLFATHMAMAVAEGDSIIHITDESERMCVEEFLEKQGEK